MLNNFSETAGRIVTEIDMEPYVEGKRKKKWEF